MAIDVVNLTEADIPEAIEVIQRAFADDPYFKWVFNPAKVCSMVPEYAEDTVEKSRQIEILYSVDQTLKLTCALSHDAVESTPTCVPRHLRFPTT
jgi:hypothetical protein